MNSKSQELLALIKKSRSKPNITASHVEEFLADYERLGRTEFLNLVAKELEKPARAVKSSRKPPHPLSGALKSAQTRTGMKAAEFKKTVLDSIDFNKYAELKRPAASVSLTKMLEVLSTVITQGDLERIIEQVGERYRLKR
ncbi:hypothetical protein [Hirschia baltica]|uniref:Uncharacterized protein n=1 Tax=Hirschia baltica (strain ATCC 49814 / DSM 5838 / IFAM 1418) TaxID=582402 RepID=C6XI42_HIRBI|nr:hypothetical protein [Hirschia baltica]ACT58868.1 hypothetical protein Hbal_1176 [Hirschia baltica ATCC 49814]